MADKYYPRPKAQKLKSEEAIRKNREAVNKIWIETYGYPLHTD